MQNRFATATLGVGIATLLNAAALAGAGPPGHHHDHGSTAAFGQPGDAKKPSRTIKVAKVEGNNDSMRFEPAKIDVKKGEQIRFVIENKGEFAHEFHLATLHDNLEHLKEMEKNPDMEHDDPNAKSVSPKGTAEVVWKFTKAGSFDYSCLVPGHRQAGMTGTVIVK